MDAHARTAHAISAPVRVFLIEEGAP